MPSDPTQTTDRDFRMDYYRDGSVHWHGSGKVVHLPSGLTISDAPQTPGRPLATDERIMAASLNAYHSPEQRVAMRGALGDAAGLCDAMAREIALSNSYGRGKVTKIGQELAAIATRCGDAIWAMREKVKVHDGE